MLDVIRKDVASIARDSLICLGRVQRTKNVCTKVWVQYVKEQS